MSAVGAAYPQGDNASAELVGLARAGDREGFRALAGCLMPAAQVEECWRGTRARLGHRPEGSGARRGFVVEGHSFTHPNLSAGEVQVDDLLLDDLLSPELACVTDRCVTDRAAPACRCGAYELDWRAR